MADCVCGRGLRGRLLIKFEGEILLFAAELKIKYQLKFNYCLCLLVHSNLKDDFTLWF